MAHAADLTWAPWGQTRGVEGKTFERFRFDGAVFGTYVVKMAAGAVLPSNATRGCEDVLVLRGELRDEHDFYVAGSYVHSPPGSGHRWLSESGCELYLKTRPTGDHDRYRVAVDTIAPSSWRQGHWPGLRKLPLRELVCSRVGVLMFEPGTRLGEHVHIDGEEFYVIEGELSDEEGNYPAGTWVRQPPGSSHSVFSRVGCRMLNTAGHLPPSLIERAR